MNASPQALQNQIINGAKALAIELSSAQVTDLYAYLELLVKWNKAYNLTAIREPERMVNLHLLDSLAVHSHIQKAKQIIDVGTGPGLPGIVLAIMNPSKTFTLLDSNGKKTRFLFQAKIALNLSNVVIVNDRVEEFKPDQLFDIVTSRAFASLSDMTKWCAHLLAKDGIFLAMKGQYPEDEIAAIAKQYDLIKSEPLTIAGVEGERHLLTIQPKA